MDDEAGGSSDPAMDRWREHSRRYRAHWTGRGQGVATDGTSWFVSQNDRNPGVTRYSPDFAVRQARADIPRSVVGHVGAVSVFEGTVYVALEDPEFIATYTTDLEELDLVPVVRPEEPDGKAHLSWIDVNPANGLVYTCDWIRARRLDAYDPRTGSPRPDHNINLETSVHRTQGGVFSPTGKVYLASDEVLSPLQQLRKWLRIGADPSHTIFPGIHGFDATTGAAVGYRRIPTRPYAPRFEEIEGLGLGAMTVDGVTTHVHLSLLNKNHSWVDDDVYLKSFAVPHPDRL